LSKATEVFVVGGGPAGLAAAIAMRQQGFRVTVADGAEPPIDKACGEGFLPDGVAELERLGIQIPSSEMRPFFGIRFLNESRSASAEFSGTRNGLAVRRTVLHRVMMERAKQLDVELLWRAPVNGISAEGVQVGGRLIRARWIVGADGANSPVRRWAGLDHGPKPRMRFAFRQHVRVAPWSDHMEVYWGARCQGYATAVSDDQVCLALASNNPQLRVEDGLAELPALKARISGAEIVSRERGALTGNHKFTRVQSGKVALIGDASGTVDAITGEGLGLAFRQAMALAETLKSGTLVPYERAHRRLGVRPRWMARLMLCMDRRPALQERTLSVLRKHPEIFRRLLELHIGERPALDAVKDGLMLGWRLLTA